MRFFKIRILIAKVTVLEHLEIFIFYLILVVVYITL